MRIIQTGNPKLWLLVGAVAGIGMLNKWTMLFFCAGIFLGLAFTRNRRLFADKWLWLGLLIGVLIWLPNIAWNVQHHWPFFELMRNVRASGRDVHLGLLPFIADQALAMNILTAPLWIAAIWWYFFGHSADSGGGRGRYRVLGWTYLWLLIFFVLANGKSYYLWPAYPMLFAAGGRAVEGWARHSMRSLGPAYAAVLLVGGALFAPFGLPVLSPEGFCNIRKLYT